MTDEKNLKMTTSPDTRKHRSGSSVRASLTGPHTIAARPWIDPAHFGRLLHIKIVASRDGTAVLTMPFLIDFAQGSGLMHGGALVSLADTAVVMAIKSLVPPGTRFATTSIETKFLFPVRSGVVTARARVTAKRQNRFYGRATLLNQDKRTVMEFRATFRMAKDGPTGKSAAKEPRNG
jgi:acyl-CoA thioesterase